MGVRFFCRLYHLFIACVTSTITNIFQNRPMEQYRFLRHQRDLFSQTFLGHMSDILSAHQNLSLFYFKKSKKKFCYCGLSSSRRPNKRHLFFRCNHEIHVVENLTGFIEIKRNILKFNTAFLNVQFLCLVRVLNFLRKIKDVNHFISIGKGRKHMSYRASKVPNFHENPNQISLNQSEISDSKNSFLP